MKKMIDCFTVGGTNAGPSLPGPLLQAMIGTRIAVFPEAHQLQVPTPFGQIIARPGDRIILYDDGTLEVKK